MEKSDEGLADDSIFEILLLLPMKSLLRLICVCKSWRKLITSNEVFSRSYLCLAIANRDSHVEILMYNTTIYEVDEKEEPYSPAIENRVVKSTQKLPNPLHLGTNFYVGGCSDGIICYYKALSRTVYLCNPALHQFRTLPMTFQNIYYRDLVGFCYNPKRHYYQVVHLSLITNSNLAHLYSLKTDSWKSIDFDCPFVSPHPEDPYISNFIPSCDPLSFNGFLHWIGTTCLSLNQAILVFDIVGEKIQLFGIPSSLYTKEMSCASLGVLNGCLSVIGTVNWRQWEVWSMRKYGVPNSWMREAIIDRYNVIGRKDPIGFSATNGRILFLKEPRSVFSYDLGNGKWSELFDLIGNHTRFDHYFVADYVESLISVMPPQLNSENSPSQSAPSETPSPAKLASSEPTPLEIPLSKSDKNKSSSYSLLIILSILFVICLTLFCFIWLMIS